jgi:tetratricopeptide (TPR) repeat protein
MKPILSPDSFHVQAAEGWLELGNWSEANEELERIAPLLLAHPDVLNLRCRIYCAAGKWDYVAEVAIALCQLVPTSSFGPLHLAHALRKLNRIKEARDTLLPVADKFPDDWQMAYHLACYSCQLGEIEEALRWLDKAIDAAGKTDIRLKALDEPDLVPLREAIAEF